MAMKIIASRNEGMKDGKNYMRAEIIADSASELSIEDFNPLPPWGGRHSD